MSVIFRSQVARVEIVPERVWERSGNCTCLLGSRARLCFRCSVIAYFYLTAVSVAVKSERFLGRSSLFQILLTTYGRLLSARGRWRRDYRRGYFSRTAVQLFADPFGSNRKQSRYYQKPKTMPFYYSPVDLCRDMGNLSISETSVADLSFSETGDWDGEDGLAMQILTATWFDDLSPYYDDDSGCGSSRSSSISSGCRTSSWESLSAIFAPTDPKFSLELLKKSQGLEIKIDLGTSIQDFQTAVLPHGNIDMYMQNRSQYHRLAQEENKEDFKQEFKEVKCNCCDFMFTVPIDQ